MTKSAKDLMDLAYFLLSQTQMLREAQAYAKKATEELAGGVATLGTLAAIASMLAERAPFHTKDASDIAKAKTFKAKAEAALKKASKALGEAPAAEALVPSLADYVDRYAWAIKNAALDPANIKKVKDFQDDKGIPPAQKLATVQAFERILAQAVEVCVRTRYEGDFAKMAEKVLDGPDHSLFSAAASAATVVANAVGNTPGPDSLAVVMLKAYATYYLPKASVSPDAARQFSDKILTAFIKAMGMSNRDTKVFRDYWIRFADAQQKVLSITRAEERLKAQPTPDAKRIDAKAAERMKAAAKLEVERARIKEYLVGEQYKRFDRVQANVAWNAAITILSIAQIGWAIYSWNDDPGKPTAQKVAEIAGSVVQGTAAAIVTFNQINIPIRVIQVRLSYLNGVVEGLEGAGKLFVSKAIAVLGLVSGAIQFVDGCVQGDFEKGAVGAAQALSSALLLAGLCFVNPLLTWAGLIIGFGILVYSLIRAISDALKKSTEKLTEGMIRAVNEKKLTWNKAEVAQVLGIKAEMKALEAAADDMSWFLIPKNPADAQDRGRILAVLGQLGFEKESAEELVEK